MSNEAFYRLAQIIGSKKRGIPAQIPVSRSTWWAWVKEGRAPAGVKLGPRTTAWKADDIQAFIKQLGGDGK